MGASIPGAANLREQEVGKEGGELGRQDLIGPGRDSAFHFKCDGKRL